ncbi:MAG: Radical SAM superfamily protein [Methanoregulaceae archaeon PtaB.Bin056]|nr:MAG: Radical SAM superfamily protein [Methanoregulaceae archaeon PtaB.Bin056]
MHRPSYLRLLETGELEQRVDAAVSLLSPCRVCPRECGIDRISGEVGYCRSGRLAVVSSYGPHFGEEPPLVGRHGSGTIFLTGCNMRCVFCQNYEISQEYRGIEVRSGELAAMMMELCERGCHNINFVSPTHFVPQVLEAVLIAAGRGLDIPLVYNTGTYDSVETLKLLDGVFDIYMPDAKYGSDEVGFALSDAPGYAGVMEEAICEMHRQVGDLVVEDGIAVKGLLVRHLVLPDHLAGSDEVLRFIARDISRDTYVNIMDQYHPCGQILGNARHPHQGSLMRRITGSEYREAVSAARTYGLHRGFPLH